MASASQCLGYLWTEVINITNYLVNISPTRANSGITPDQKYYGSTSRVDHLHIFGVVCFLHIPKENQSKLGSKSIKCIFTGYDDKSKVYKVFEPTRKQIHLSRDVIFDEQQIGFHLITTPCSTPEEPVIFPSIVHDETDIISQDNSPSKLPIDSDLPEVEEDSSIQPSSSPGSTFASNLAPK
jgi:hypothetical protein